MALTAKQKRERRATADQQQRDNEAARKRKRRQEAFAQKKADVGSGDRETAGVKERDQMPTKVDALLRSSSLVQMLKAPATKRSARESYGTQGRLDLSRIINM